MRAPLSSSMRLLTEALEHVTRALRAAKHAAFVTEAMGPATLAASSADAARGHQRAPWQPFYTLNVALGGGGGPPK